MAHSLFHDILPPCMLRKAQKGGHVSVGQRDANRAFRNYTGNQKLSEHRLAIVDAGEVHRNCLHVAFIRA